jgi:putative sterol carrier protein
VSVKFLSTEWADALSAELNRSDAFRQAAAGKQATIQQVITGPDTHYWTTIADGSITMGLGDAGEADATITQSYDTSVALARRELSPVTGFMMGKIKVAGNMGLILGLQAVLAQLPEAMAAIEVEY